MKRFLCPSALALLAAATAHSQTLQVDSITQGVGNQMTVTVKNTGSSTSFQLQGSSSLAAGGWSNVTTTFSPVAGQSGVVQATFTKPAGKSYFVRVVGTSGTAEDADGDGLAGTLEATLGTNSSLFDTDNDGFSDGVEFSYGTDPKSAASKPNNGLPPAVEFAVTDLDGTEGTPATVNLVFDRSFSGTVRYNVIAARSTAKAPADYAALNGTVAVNGTTASFQIDWVDNLTVDPIRLLFINLVTNPGQNYTTGPRDFLTVRLNDNDAYWQGTLAPFPDSETAGKAFLLRDLRLKFVNGPGTRKVFFIAGPGFDGLPALAGETPATATSQTEGVVPAGSWEGVINVLQADDFWITSPPMPIPAAVGKLGVGGSLFGPATDLTRTLNFDALPGATPYNAVTPTRIGGVWTETVASQNAPHLNRVAQGMFVLQKDAPTVAPVPSFLAQ